MTETNKFAGVIAVSMASSKAREELSARQTSEAVARASSAFEPTAKFILALGHALKKVDPTISLKCETKWVPDREVNAFKLSCKLDVLGHSSCQGVFRMKADFSTFEFNNLNFSLNDQVAIENALKHWVVTKIVA